MGRLGEGEALGSAGCRLSHGLPSQELPSPTAGVPALARCCPPERPGGAGPPSLPAGAWVECGHALSALLSFNSGLQKLVSAIYADYARSLKNLGFKQGAILFASKAGAAGRDLLNELESPKQELAEE